MEFQQHKNGYSNSAFQAPPKKTPPPLFQVITQEPLSGYSHNGVYPHSEATLEPLNCLSRQNELYIKQSANIGCFYPEMLQVLDGNQQRLLSVTVTSHIYPTGGITRDFIVSDTSGRIVIRFVEKTGAQVTSGGLSLGVIRRPYCCSEYISATTAVGMETFSLCIGACSHIFPFCIINSFKIKRNGSVIGKFEKITNGPVKITFPTEMDIRSKALLLSLSLKGYLDIFSKICGCSTGLRGPKAISCYLGIAIVMVVFIVALVNILQFYSKKGEYTSYYQGPYYRG